MVADSRQVALNHTAGLSLPQQMQMSLFASFSLLDKENTYRHAMLNLIHTRLKALWDNTGFILPRRSTKGWLLFRDRHAGMGQEILRR